MSCHENVTNADLSNIPVPFRALIGALFAVLIILSLIGNSLVCIAIMADRKLRKNENLFLISLAASDILVAILVMSFAAMNDMLGRWVFGSFCTVWISSDVMCCTASILNLAAISFDRYWHIRYPMRYATFMTRPRILAVIGVIWLVAAGISFVPLLTRRDSYEASTRVCRLDFGPLYTVLSSLVSFFIPCIGMVVVYARMYMFARAHVQMLKQQYRSMGTVVTLAVPQIDDRHNGSASTASVAYIEYSDHKARITVGVIMGVFLASWFPFFTINIVRAFTSCLPQWLFQAVTWIGYGNSAANPIIYSILSRDFRSAFYKILLCNKWQQFYASTQNIASIFGSSHLISSQSEAHMSRCSVVKYNSTNTLTSVKVVKTADRYSCYSLAVPRRPTMDREERRRLSDVYV